MSEELPPLVANIAAETIPPTGPERFDAIVIGGGIGGLVAAAYLARGGQRTVLFESRDVLGGRGRNVAVGGESGGGAEAPLLADTAFALDRAMVSDLQLYTRGLAFAERAMPLVGLKAGGRHLVLSHDLFSARAAIRAELAGDANAYMRFRREVFAFARRLRPLWTPDRAWPKRQSAPASVAAVAQALELPADDTAMLDLLARSSVAAYLERWFENDALKAALALDTCMDGFAPHEAGSALALFWRAAQESCGLQGAVSQISGGPAKLIAALAGAAREAGAELRLAKEIASIVSENGRVQGVTLSDGAFVAAPIVISSLGPRRTLDGLLAPSAMPFGHARRPAATARTASARVIYTLSGPAPFAGLDRAALRGRLVVAERPESASEAKGAALAGKLPIDLVLEIGLPTVADPPLGGSQHVVTVRVPHLPVAPQGGWAMAGEILNRRVLSVLESFAPGLGERVTSAAVLSPDEIEARFGPGDAPPMLERLLSTYEARLRTPLQGLYLCGGAAEPADALSGRAGRIAAELAVAERSAS